jgi:hypothetical protein
MGSLGWLWGRLCWLLWCADQRNKLFRRYVLPDGPTARGAATSWRVYLLVAGTRCMGLAMLGGQLFMASLKPSQAVAMVFWSR